MNSAYLKSNSKNEKLFLSKLIDDYYGLTIKSYEAYDLIVSLIDLNAIKNEITPDQLHDLILFMGSLFKKANIELTKFAGEIYSEESLFNMKTEIISKLKTYEYVNHTDIKTELKKALGYFICFNFKVCIGEE